MATVEGLTATYINAQLDLLVKSAEFDGSGHLILTLRDDTEVDAGAPSLSTPDASETVKGIVELATIAETAAGTDTTRAVTPDGLESALDTFVPAKMPTATTTTQGKVELATDAEVTTGTDAVRAATPSGVAAAIASNNTSNVTPRPLGVVARRTRTSNGTATTSATGQGFIKLSFSAVNGRQYNIKTNGLHMTGGASDEVALRVFMTTNGVDPTTSDTEVCTVQCTIANASRYNILEINEFIVAGATGTIKVTLFFARLSGTAGNANVHATGTNVTPAKFWVEDMGVPVADAGGTADI
jgi:hypothetical protein